MKFGFHLTEKCGNVRGHALNGVGRSFGKRGEERVEKRWHGRRDLNPQQAVLETAALPIELLPYASEGNIKPGNQPSDNKCKKDTGEKSPPAARPGE